MQNILTKKKSVGGSINDTKRKMSWNIAVRKPGSKKKRYQNQEKKKHRKKKKTCPWGTRMNQREKPLVPVGMGKMCGKRRGYKLDGRGGREV